jgi:pyruvate formate lyase activating enzyme
VRENRDGTVYNLEYGHTAGQDADPIEKKPLFHFFPGSTAYSITTVGCNFHSQFCQNWQISQVIDPAQFLELSITDRIRQDTARSLTNGAGV